MSYNFTIRIHKYLRTICIYDINTIEVSNIKIYGKYSKYDGFCEFKSNKKKFGYSYTINGAFSKVAGSHSSPILWHNKEYLDIEVKNFPRFPVITQDKYIARNLLNGNFQTTNGFPHWVGNRKIEFINITKN